MHCFFTNPLLFSDSLLGISAGGLIATLITATVGAVVLLFVVGLVKKA